MRAFLGIIFFGLVAVVAGTLGFQAGVASSLAAGTGGVPALLYLSGGFHFGSFLFFLLFLGLVMAVVSRGRRRRWAAFGPMARGPWMTGQGPASDADPRHQWVAEAHRRLHEEEARAASRPSADGTASTTGPAAS